MNGNPPVTSPATPAAYNLSTSQPPSHSPGHRYTPERLGNQPGTDQLCTRLNRIDNVLQGMESSECARLCSDFTGSFHGLGNILVNEESQLPALTVLLTLINCNDRESILCFGEKLTDSGNEHASDCLKAMAKLDNSLETPAPTGDTPQATKPFGLLRRQLLENFVASEMTENLGLDAEESKTILQSLIQAIMQVAAGTGVGNWESPIEYDRFNQETVAHIASRLVHPGHQQAADLLKQENQRIQQQFFEPDSDLMVVLCNSETITWLLNEDEHDQLVKRLTTATSNNSTISNETALLSMLATSEPALEDRFSQINLNPVKVNWLAKANCMLNLAEAANKKTFSNDDANHALADSIAFTHSFLKSQHFADHKKENPGATDAAIAARWIIDQAENNQTHESSVTDVCGSGR